jgi:hypothetical protein
MAESALAKFDNWGFCAGDVELCKPLYTFCLMNHCCERAVPLDGGEV